MERRFALGYLMVMVVNAGLAALGQELAAGRVPLPDSWRWLIPVVLAVVTALTALLPGIDQGPRATRVRKLRIKR